MIKPNNLLIVRTDRIGDVVLTIPLAGIIKKHYPECNVSFLVKNYVSGLLKNHPYIDNTIILKEENRKIPFIKNLRKIKEYKFDTAVIVYPTFKIALIMLLAGIKNRIGTGYRWYSFLFNKRIFEHRKYAEKHELEYNVNLLEILNIRENISRTNVKYDLKINSKSELKVSQLLLENKVNLNEPTIIFHPGSGGSSIDLPVSKFKQLLELTAQQLKVNIILTGNTKEKRFCRTLVVNKSIKNFAGLLNLAELAALINKSSLMVANSTGPIHIAAALNKQVLGFYPKIKACSQERWGPYTEKSFIFTPKIDCSNCSREQCERLNCMSSIDVNEIFESIKKVVSINHVEK